MSTILCFQDRREKIREKRKEKKGQQKKTSQLTPTHTSLEVQDVVVNQMTW